MLRPQLHRPGVRHDPTRLRIWGSEASPKNLFCWPTTEFVTLTRCGRYALIQDGPPQVMLVAPLAVSSVLGILCKANQVLLLDWPSECKTEQ